MSGIQLKTLEEFLEFGIAKFPNDVQSTLMLAVMYAQKQEPSKFLPLISKALRRLVGLPIGLVTVEERAATYALSVMKQIERYDEFLKRVPGYQYKDLHTAAQAMWRLCYYHYLLSDYNAAKLLLLSEFPSTMVSTQTQDSWMRSQKSKIHQGLSCVYREQKELTKASSSTAVAIRHGGKSRDGCTSWICEGAVMLEKKQVRNAIDCFRKAIEISDYEPWAWLSLGTAFLRTKEWEDAVNSFELIFDIEESSDKQHRLFAMGGLALAYDGLKTKSEFASVVESFLGSEFAKGVSKEKKRYKEEMSG